MAGCCPTPRRVLALDRCGDRGSAFTVDGHDGHAVVPATATATVVDAPPGCRKNVGHQAECMAPVAGAGDMNGLCCRRSRWRLELLLDEVERLVPAISLNWPLPLLAVSKLASMVRQSNNSPSTRERLIRTLAQAARDPFGAPPSPALASPRNLSGLWCWRASGERVE